MDLDGREGEEGGGGGGGEVQKRGEENRSPSLAELCRMQQNTVPPMEDCQAL